MRVEKSAGSTSTVYIFSRSHVIAEYDNGAAVSSPTRENIYSGATLLATIYSSGTNYYLRDHRAIRVTTDANANVIGQQGHFPYGEPWYMANTTTKWTFDSYERDSETGNDYAQARYHINRLGRFASPDPVTGNIGDPQSLNRYSYVRNMPIDLEDPTGMFGQCHQFPVAANPHSHTDKSAGGSGPEADADGASDADLDAEPQISCISDDEWQAMSDLDLIVYNYSFGGQSGGGQGPTGGGGGGGLPNLPPPRQPLPLAIALPTPPAPPTNYEACITAALEEVIAHGEGTDGPNGYGLLVYGQVVRATGQYSNLQGQTGSPNNPIVIDPNTLTAHPHVLVNAGVSNSTAFGRYQITAPTAAHFGITNFSPAGQDAGAATIMQSPNVNMLGPALNGNFEQSMANGSGTWASLPGSTAGQPTMTMAQASGVFQRALQTLPICQ